MPMMIFNESGKGYWMDGCGCLRAEGENRPSRPCHIVVGCDLYNGSLTGGVACNMNANSNTSANHAGPSVLVVEYCGDRSDPSVSTETSYCIPPDPVNDRQQAICFEPGIVKREGGGSRYTMNKTGTLRANMGDNQPCVCIPLTNRGVVPEGGCRKR